MNIIFKENTKILNSLFISNFLRNLFCLSHYLKSVYMLMVKFHKKGISIIFYIIFYLQAQIIQNSLCNILNTFLQLCVYMLTVSVESQME